MPGASQSTTNGAAHKPATDDEWLILCRRAREGDAVAFGDLCERLRSFLTHAAGCQLNGSLKAKLGASDLVQESLLEAHRQFEQFQGSTEEEFRGWVRQILHNNTIDAARKFHDTQMRDADREISLELVESPEQLTARGKTASSVARRKETDHEMLVAVGKLPERRRLVVEMRFRDGLNHAEIGKQLGISELAARKLLSRASRRPAFFALRNAPCGSTSKLASAHRLPTKSSPASKACGTTSHCQASRVCPRWCLSRSIGSVSSGYWAPVRLALSASLGTIACADMWR